MSAASGVREKDRADGLEIQLAAAVERETTLRAALKAAVLGLRSLDGMTGSADNRRTHINAAGYRVAEALGLGDVGYHPLDSLPTSLGGMRDEEWK